MNFIATIHGIYDDTKSQFAVSTATHPPGHLEIEKGLDKGAVTVKDSFNYKSLDDELIELNLWNKEKR